MIDSKHQTFWRRYWAGVIDIVFLMILLFLCELILFRMFWSQNPTISALIFSLTIWSLFPVVYSILLTGFFGQTIGKYLSGVKVLSISESKLGVFRAFLRDCPWLFFEIARVLTCLLFLNDSSEIKEKLLKLKFMYAVGIFWYMLEIVTMLTNSKRRAVHDFIAGSVVVKTKGVISEFQ